MVPLLIQRKLWNIPLRLPKTRRVFGSLCQELNIHIRIQPHWFLPSSADSVVLQLDSEFGDHRSPRKERSVLLNMLTPSCGGVMSLARDESHDTGEVAYHSGWVLLAMV